MSRQIEVCVFAKEGEQPFWAIFCPLRGNILHSLRRYLSTFIVAPWEPWILDQFDLRIYGEKLCLSNPNHKWHQQVENIFVFMFGWPEASKNLASASIWGFWWKFAYLIIVADAADAVSVNFYRFNAKNWHFQQILREKVAFFTDLTRKIGVFRCKFYSPKILPV